MRENAWLTTASPVPDLFAPYGGITRFRFKGSSDLSDLSAIGSPASTNVNGKNESGKQESRRIYCRTSARRCRPRIAGATGPK
jgi:hypothetical protein